MAANEGTQDPGRVEGKRRFGQLPERVAPDDMVGSQPLPPPPERGFDPAEDAVRRFGLPI